MEARCKTSRDVPNSIRRLQPGFVKINDVGRACLDLSLDCLTNMSKFSVEGNELIDLLSDDCRLRKIELLYRFSL